MTDKQKIPEILFRTLAILLILLVLVNQHYMKKSYIQDEIDTFNYCVEWDTPGGLLTREDLVWFCYNFDKQEVTCDWKEVDDKLLVYEYKNEDNIFFTSDCNLYVKAIKKGDKK